MRALFAFIAPLALVAAAPAWAQTVTVPADHAGLVRLSQDAETIVVGNPAIADAMLHGPRTVFVSGRVYGQTNLIALNSEGQVIMAADIAVTQSDRGHVEVLRGATSDSAVSQATYVCNPVCRPSLSVGDTPERFDTINAQRQAVTGAASSLAGG